MSDSDEDYDIPLAQLKKKLSKDKNSKDCVNYFNYSEDEFVHDSDSDPEYKQTCEVHLCKKEVWAACQRCLILVCWDHFMEDISTCADHGVILRENKKKEREESLITRNIPFEQSQNVVENTEQTVECEQRHTVAVEDAEKGEQPTPEVFFVEGSPKESATPIKRKMKKDTRSAKKSRDSGEEYISPKSKTLVPKRQLQPRCNCKSKWDCDKVTDEDRTGLFSDYWGMGSLSLQREFICRHIDVTSTLQKTKGTDSRRKQTKAYHLQLLSGQRARVCQKMFLNTFSISEKTTRTALEKLQVSGVISADRRGGRARITTEKDQKRREAVLRHIKRFPAVESHYCRATTKRVYLSEDLTFSKMYRMCVSEWSETTPPPSFRLYLRLCREQKISIHRPKKDQCSLCNSYRQGADATKENLKERYESHISEKNTVRELKEACKKQAKEDKKILCANFDLQQVMYLPSSKDSQIFYKRRLSNFNFTFYNIGASECDCFVWHEGQGGRGSSEMSTCVHEALKFYDEQGCEKAFLFADGCGGQNKNSIFPAMMLFFVLRSKTLKEISLRYFVTTHGQSEGDSVHSAVARSFSRAGDVFQTCQLEPIIQSARKNQPYKVHMLYHQQFLDFKKYSKELRILDSRSEKVDWNDIMEVKVVSKFPDRIFYKTSHLACEYSEIILRRLPKPISQYQPGNLYSDPLKLSKGKHDDLMKLCNGDLAVVKDPFHREFYLNLNYENE